MVKKLNESSSKSFGVLLGYNVSKMIDELESMDYIDKDLADTITNIFNETASIIEENLKYFGNVEIRFSPASDNIPGWLNTTARYYSVLEYFVSKLREKYGFIERVIKQVNKSNDRSFEDDDYIEFRDDYRDEIKKLVKNLQESLNRVEKGYTTNYLRSAY